MFVYFGEQKFVKSHCIIKHGGIVSIKTDVAISLHPHYTQVFS